MLETATNKVSFVEALNQALREEMQRDSRVFILGEDIGRMGGLFKVTQGLLEVFGPDRVVDTPISEAAFAGAGIGAALLGLRPVIELQFADFITIAMDQIVNHAAKLRYMSGGSVMVPIVFRAPVCGGVGLGAQHSQSLEAWFVHVPGLKVVMPSTPGDAKALLKSAIRDENPVVFFEHRLLYGQTGPIANEEFLIPLGRAAIKRRGSDVTLVATGRTVSLALNAAERLAMEGIQAEVIDPRTLKPLDWDTIFESVRKTSRAVIISDGCRTCGFGSELAATISGECFFDLDAPVRLVCGKDVPAPVAPGLQKAVMVSDEDIVSECREVLRI